MQRRSSGPRAFRAEVIESPHRPPPPPPPPGRGAVVVGGSREKHWQYVAFLVWELKKKLEASEYTCS